MNRVRERSTTLRALFLWLGLGLVFTASAQATCSSLDPIEKDRLSVAWVSPLGVNAWQSTWIPVVQTAQLRGALDETGGDLARMLQILGLRKKSKPPKRRYKVVIFEVSPEYLCRPIDGVEPDVEVDGQPACLPRLSKTKRNYKGCGFTTDRLDGARGLDVYRTQWRDAAQSGFCVLPADRFVQGE